MTDNQPVPDSTPQEKPVSPVIPAVVPYYFDALKLLGTGNSTGLFGAFVAFYYFAGRGPSALFWIKIAGAFYLLGICLFALAYIFLFWSILHNYEVPISTDHQAIEQSETAAVKCSVLSLIMWWMGTVTAAYVLIILPTVP